MFKKSVLRLMVANSRFRLMFLALVVISILGLLLSFSQTDVRYCFTEDESFSSQSGPVRIGDRTLQRLEDVLVAKKKPLPGRTIFFHETSCHQPEPSRIDTIFHKLNAMKSPRNLVQLTPRQACAIESAALHNPNFNVFVLFASPAYLDNCTSNAIVEAVLSYSNVHLRNLNLWTYAADTPIHNWLEDGKLFRSSYVLSHISDFLRYLTLWRWGGTYLDMDIIMLKSMENVPPNYTGAESDTHLAAGAMNFAPTGFGHEIARKCLDDFQHHFDGKDWGNNGPGVITRVMQTICATKSITLMTDQKRCLGFQVFRTEAFYAVSWTEWYRFFEEKYLEETLKRTQNSYLVHVWNKYSKQRRIKVGSEVAYGKLAEKNCPKVYAAAGEYF